MFPLVDRNAFLGLQSQLRSDIGLLRVDNRNSTIDSRNDTRNNVE